MPTGDQLPPHYNMEVEIFCQKLQNLSQWLNHILLPQNPDIRQTTNGSYNHQVQWNLIITRSLGP